MALPIRLIVGPDNIMEIPLEAQSVDITVNRNASAFPTPNNIVGRVAIDTNIPEIDLEISGIFQDDDSATFDVEKTSPHISGGDIVFNFASALPTSNLALNRDETIGVETGSDFSYYTVEFKDEDAPFEISKGVTDLIDIYDIAYDDVESTGAGTNKFLDELLQSLFDTTETTINHPSSGTYSSGTNSIIVLDGSIFTTNTRVHLANGTYAGFITAIVGNTLTFSDGTEVALAHGDTLTPRYKTTLYTARGQVIGSVIGGTTSTNTDSPFKFTHLKLDGISIPIYADIKYYLVLDSNEGYSAPPTEQLLNNKKISLYPHFWRIDNHVSSLSWVEELAGLEPSFEPLGVHLVFSTDMAHTDYQNKLTTGHSYPTIISEGEHYPKYNGGDRIAGEGDRVRIKVPIGGITTHAVNGNPASTLALIVKKALELTTDVMDKGYITSTDGETLASAFSVEISGPLLRVKQKDVPINANLFSVLQPCLQHDASESFEMVTSITPARIEHFTDTYALNSVSVNAKSAGDKVQDLLGLVSNAKKNKDLIRGIQIPYDSLIQSDAVTPTARNFFLTFGKQKNKAKGSEENALSASHRMVPQLLPGDEYFGGDTPLSDDNSFAITDFTEAVQALGSFVSNFVSDTFVTLLSEPHGNDGGIRIIPEKFHVHYDAGNKYYAYKLILKASDFVIGV